MQSYQDIIVLIQRYNLIAKLKANPPFAFGIPLPNQIREGKKPDLSGLGEG